MTLASGDRLFFDVAPVQLTLQFISRKNLTPEDEEYCPSDRTRNASTVFLRPRDVAVLLNVLEYPKPVVFKYEAPWGGLVVYPPGNLTAPLGLEAGDNKVALTAPEREMLHGAIQSRAWRLFQ
jgi:hypothetical protein